MAELLALLGTSVGLGVGAGVNAYATLLVFGLIARFQPSLFPGAEAQFFASTPVLITLGVLYTVEFFADKVPTIDHAWDAIHTFIRPAAGALVAFSAASREIPNEWVILASVIAGGAALTSHVGKASLRAGSTVTTGGLANPILSVIEDVVAIVGTMLALLLPYVMFVVSIVLVIAIFTWAARRSRRRAQAL